MSGLHHFLGHGAIVGKMEQLAWESREHRNTPLMSNFGKDGGHLTRPSHWKQNKSIKY
jgi:hypothetical protein